ncbi:MAG: enoyl-CoA hydratase-related protein [Candidatus Binatia bacterium]
MANTQYEIRGRAGWITLDAPQSRNALSAELIVELDAHLRAAMADDAVRVVVLTGNGPAFCAGADLKTGGGGAVARDGAPRNPFIEILKLMWDGPKPVIAAVNGHAFGGGLGLVAAADIAIAAESAKFAFSEVRIGVIPAMISVVVLRKLGIHQGMRLFLTGETFDAPRALGYGLLHRVVTPAGLRAAVEADVAAIALGGPNAVREAKRLVRTIPDLSMDEGFAMTQAKIAELFASPEAAEGMMAFGAKRKPSWAADDT